MPIVLPIGQRGVRRGRTFPCPPPSFAKNRLRGQKPSICEEFLGVNFILENLTWGNAGRSASERSFPSLRTHISTIIVHRTSFFEKKGAAPAMAGRGGCGASPWEGS